MLSIILRNGYFVLGLMYLQHNIILQTLQSYSISLVAVQY